MAPIRSANASRRAASAHDHPPAPNSSAPSASVPPEPTPNVNPDLFIDPMLGTPLAVYIEKDVDDKDELVKLVTVRAIDAFCSLGASGAVGEGPLSNLTRNC